jgi:hypothetical protein
LLPIEVRLDPGAATGNLVGVLATLLLSRARRATGAKRSDQSCDAKRRD